MNVPTEVAQAADALLTALRNTETFQVYEELKRSVMADEVNRRLLDRFMRAQSALQMAAMAGSEPREEDTALLYQSSEVTDFLLAQMRVQQLVAQTMSRITGEAGISIELREA